MRRGFRFPRSSPLAYDSLMKEPPPKSRSRKTSKPKPPAGASRRSPRKPSAAKAPSTALRIKLRGKDGAPLSIAEVQQGLMEAARELRQYDGLYRAKWASVFLTLIDDNGNEVVVIAGGEITLHPYKSAAEEFGI
jgi:hypothetical protein